MLKIHRVSLFTLLSILSSGVFAANEAWDKQFGVPGSHPGGVAAVVRFRNKLVAGGAFTSIGGVAATNLGQWDGSNWSPLGDGVGGVVYALAVAEDELYVAGHFDQAGNVKANNLARWNGTNWSCLGEGVNDVTFALASDGANLYAGGHFTIAGMRPAGKIARWDGTNWSGLGLGIVGVVGTLAVDGSNVYAGGNFRVAGGVAATNIARWDGEAWHDLQGGLRNFDYDGAENGGVGALVVEREHIYVGGEFRLAGSTTATNIASWDGRRWADLRGGINGLGSVSSLTFNGTELFAGGGFTNIGGTVASRLAKWDGQDWSCLGSGVSNLGGLSGTVFGLVSTGSELIVAGLFDSAGGLPSTNIALWHIPHQLAIHRSANEVQLSWSGTGSNFVLEACSDLSQAVWSPLPQWPELENGEWVVTNAVAPSTEFYRLRRR